MSDLANKQRQFSKFYEQHYETVYRIVRSRKFPYNTLRDTVSLIFEKAWLDFDQYRKNKDIKWLYKIISNEVRNVTRNKHFKQTLTDDIEPYITSESSSNPTEEKIIEEEKMSIILQLIANLPDRQKTCVMLNVQGYTFTESAKMMGVSVQAVHKLFKKAMTKIIPVLETYQDE